jgi:carboxyl-terminal processing protease
MPKNSRLVPALLLIIVIALAFAGGYVFGISHTSKNEGILSVSPNASASYLSVERRESIGEVWDIILTDYVDLSRLDSVNLSRAAIDGMLQALDDPYTSYLDVETYTLGKSILEGSYDGIGAYVTIKDKQLTIIAPIADSPADKAGIKAGDIIVQIDGKPVTNLSLAEAIIKIRGPKGTAVKLLVLHQGETAPVEIEIIRATFDLPSLRFEMKGEIAYINITDFTERTPDELAAALQNLTDKKATGIILDLRGNPGGLLDQVVDVASFFLSQGVVVEIRSNQGQITALNVNEDRPKNNLPMVVLVDKASASGSEVLAGALQDHGRATIAGTTTYGKGSVNVLYPLGDGSGLYITVGRWLTPNGRLIEGQGIEPDIKLELTGEEAVQWAIDYLMSDGGVK